TTWCEHDTDDEYQQANPPQTLP
ncbi:MAG: hypothetical protein QOI10_4354, partial [Solirubrobacterales bacterium]|nr:hypothetical protein [Solirubrobacterales bacterium]